MQRGEYVIDSRRSNSSSSSHCCSRSSNNDIVIQLLLNKMKLYLFSQVENENNSNEFY